MAEMLIGCGQITWPRGTPQEHVLAEIAQADYAGAPVHLGGRRSAQETIALYAQYGLKPAPGYFGADFWRAEQQADILKRAREYGRFMRECDCTELYLGPGGFEGYVTASGKNRKELAGHVGTDDGLTGAEWQQLADCLNRVGEITLEEGVRSCFHNHVGSVIETLEEIERMLQMTDPDLVFLGPDTGHLAWAAADSVDFCRKYADRIKTIHAKDVHAGVVERGAAEDWDYDTFVDHGLFAELGDGCVDFAAVFDALRAAGFAGWVIVETDVTQKPTALESATISREYLSRLGL
jgi:inosose dehydratase